MKSVRCYKVIRIVDVEMCNAEMIMTNISNNHELYITINDSYIQKYS